MIALVVYTNPAAEWFWESGIAPYFFTAVIALLVVLFAVIWFDDRSR